MDVFEVAVIGAGTMGAELAQVVAAAGLPVVLADADEAAVDAAVARVRTVTATQAAKLVERGKLDQAGADAQVAEVAGRVRAITGYDGLGGVDLVVEAVPEDLDLKRAVFAELDASTPGHAVLASNTSGLSISEIGAATTRPDKVVGLHVLWPAATMRIVEVVEGEDTSAETVQAAVRFAGRVKKTPVRCLESPGFVVNRLLGAFAGEAWRHQEETGERFEEVDRAVVDAGLAPVGPFALADRTGLDTTLAAARELRAHYGDRFHVHRDLIDLVDERQLGAKTGRGFHQHG